MGQAGTLILRGGRGVSGSQGSQGSSGRAGVVLWAGGGPPQRPSLQRGAHQRRGGRRPFPPGKPPVPSSARRPSAGQTPPPCPCSSVARRRHISGTLERALGGEGEGEPRGAQAPLSLRNKRVSERQGGRGRMGQRLRRGEGVGSSCGRDLLGSDGPGSF